MPKAPSVPLPSSLSNRLTGGASNSSCLSGNQQAGEGWSDLCTLFFTAVASDADVTPRGVGSYVLYDDSPGRSGQQPWLLRRAPGLCGLSVLLSQLA